MKKTSVICAFIALVSGVACAETVFEAKGPVTDKTPGFRFGNVTFTDNDRVCARFEAVPMGDGVKGRLTTKRLRLPHKKSGKGAYFKLSFTAGYTYTPGKPGGKILRCNQGVFFYDKKGRVLPDCYDTLYPVPGGRRYTRVLYAWDEVEEIELFFQKPWAMKEKNGDTCTLEISDVLIETATWEDAVKYSDDTYAEMPPLDFKPQGDWTTLIPRTMDALKTGKPWRVVMLGDSIIQDTFHSQFHALVKKAFPASNAEWILSMRGGTGCWHYILAENFYAYVADHKPDLLIIGGISNYAERNDTSRKDIGPTGADAMVRVAKTARARLGCEVLLVNSPLHCDRRPHDGAASGEPLPKMKFSSGWLDSVSGGKLQHTRLKTLCAKNKMQWWDETTPCYTWLFGSGLPFEWYSRDAVHSGERGKQIIGRVMLSYFLTGKDAGGNAEEATREGDKKSVRGSPAIWDMKRLSDVPKTRAWPGEFKGEVTPVMIEGEPYEGRPTWCYAYYGVPGWATPARKAPAIVLVHGGLGTAYPEWVRMWVKRGYAAICVDTCGALPVRAADGSWLANPEGGPRGWGRIECSNDPVREQWMYHAVAAVIRSHSFIRSLPCVDTRAVGVTGISWGGFITCILAAVDDRFAYAASVYGCGFNFERGGPAWSHPLAGKWASLWDASVYLPQAKCPMLWVDGTNDFAFSLDRVRRSAALASGVEHAFSTHLRMVHGHGEPGEGPREILAFADRFARGGRDVVRVGACRREGRRISVPFAANGREIARAELLWTADGRDVKWDKRYWNTRAIDGFDPSSGTVSVELTEKTFAWIVNLVTDDGLVFSSPYEETRP